ncbi:MAG: adenosylcobinamide-GDP ribazoletransferase [Bacteroidaceae bacterium]|nr:adenosylcobinamide-GDP ribazoletransferase [Bacteroidaceae bacterium]
MKTIREIAAAIMFFTRIPLWRVVKATKEDYRHVLDYWPLTGLITGAGTALVLYASTCLFPLSVAVIIAIAFRLLLTGCLHEDGLADFIDGMGGGSTRERRLEIMKDSHIGTYGVVGLVIYFLIIYNAMQILAFELGVAIIVGTDMWSKLCASFTIENLPYARSEEEAKNRLVYSKGRTAHRVAMLLLAIAPTVVFVPNCIWGAALAPIAVCLTMYFYMKHKIGGYTGDCCGATFLMAEASYYLAALAIL